MNSKSSKLNNKSARLRESEADIQRSILEYLQIRGIFAERRNVGAMVSEYKGRKRFTRFSSKGAADIWGILPFPFCLYGRGTHLEIEVKRPGNQLSPEQEAFRDAVTRSGGLFILATSVSDVEKALRLGW